MASEQMDIEQVEVAADQFIGSLVGIIVIHSTLAQQPRLFDDREIINWVETAVQVFMREYCPTSR